LIDPVNLVLRQPKRKNEHLYIGPKMATAFGVRLLGTALVVISGFYRFMGQETSVDFLPIIAKV